MKTIGLCLLMLLSSFAFSQSRLTTFILVRHAEKETSAGSGQDPVLSDEGRRRATRLMDLLLLTPIAAVYATPFQRTHQTVFPLAQAKSITIKEYHPDKMDEINRMWVENEGQTILVCGHSNTIPRLANYLTGTKNYKDFDDLDYSNLIVITVLPGKPASVTWLKY
ncbi:MAG: histidine phosphatase family protein [Bacteroidetes bacterium]|nr:histidine phosphatase family protein [Bacteroidota bacterium]